MSVKKSMAPSSYSLTPTISLGVSISSQVLMPPSSLVLSFVCRAVEGDVVPGLGGGVVAGAVGALQLADVV